MMQPENAVREAVDALINNDLDPDPASVSRLAGAILIANSIDYGFRSLGLADAATPMGAIEALSVEVKDVARALGDIAQAVNEMGAELTKAHPGAYML